MPSASIALNFSNDLSPDRNEDALVACVPVDIKDSSALLDSLARQLQFPGYFGYNWDALWDCIRDFHWTTIRKIVIIHEGLPAGLTEEEVQIYLDILNDAVAEWRSEGQRRWSRYLGAPHFHELEVIFPVECRAEIERILQA